MSSEEDLIEESVDIGEDDEEEEEEGAVGLSADVEINDRYLEMLADAYIRQALSLVKRDDKSGDISGTKTRHTLLKWFGSLKRGAAEFDPSLIRILTFLNSVWFTGCDSLSPEFWWVNKTKIEDLVYVALIAHAFQMKSKKQKGSAKDIPKCVMFIHDYIERECKNAIFAELVEEFAQLCEDNQSFCHVYNKCFKDRSK